MAIQAASPDTTMEPSPPATARDIFQVQETILLSAVSSDTLPTP